MKSSMSWLALIVAAVAGAAATHFYKERSIAKFEREVAAKEAHLDSLRTEIAVRQANYDSMKAQIEAERDSIEELYAAAKATAAQLSEDIEDLADSLMNQLPPELQPAFLELQHLHAQRIAAKDAQIIALNQIIIRQDSLIAAGEELNGRLQTALTESVELRDFWKDKAKRDWWEKPLFTIPATIATVLLVETAVQAVSD